MIDIFSFASVTSTNDYAKILLEKRNAVIITANHQTKGRGRNNKRWMGDYGGNIFLSYGVMHENANKDVHQSLLIYQCIGCLAVKKALETIASTCEFALKYPNDIYALQSGEWRKISGVLVENEFVGATLKSSVLGIGVNGMQMEFGPEIVATSLVLLDVNVEVIKLKQLMIKEIFTMLNLQPNQVIEEWKKVLKIKNKKIRIVGENDDWIVEGFNEFGMLEVESKGIRKVIGNGDSIRYNLS